jgi:hypothetical protein
MNTKETASEVEGSMLAAREGDIERFKVQVADIFREQSTGGQCVVRQQKY